MQTLDISVDFDGTCLTHEYPELGKDVGAVPVLRDLVAAGHRLILNTMRGHKLHYGVDTLAEAVAWFGKNGIPLYGINNNPRQGEWTSSPKVHAQIQIDDAALGAPLVHPPSGKRPYIDWAKVREMLQAQGVLP